MCVCFSHMVFRGQVLRFLVAFEAQVFGTEKKERTGAFGSNTGQKFRILYWTLPCLDHVTIEDAKYAH